MSQRVHSQPELSVVIAVGDQEDSIGHLIRNVASHLTALGRSYEILIVNAGCRDNSLSIASVLARTTMPEIEVLARDAAGRAFLRGTSEARGDVVVLLDASKPASLAPLAWALSRIAAGRDAVVLRGRYVVARRLAVLPVDRARVRSGRAVRGGVRTPRARAGNRHRRVAAAPPGAAVAAAGVAFPGRVARPGRSRRVDSGRGVCPTMC